MAETVQEYTERILSLAHGFEPFDVLASAPARIGALIAGRSIGDPQRSSAPWCGSIAQAEWRMPDGARAG